MTASAGVRAELEHRPAAAPEGVLAAFTLPAVPESAGAARRRVRAALAPSGLRDLAGDAELIVSELTANAVQHAGSPVDVVLFMAGRVLLIIAADSSPTPPVKRAANDGKSGRGLVLIDAIADQWGWWQSSAGKSVWAAVGFAGVSPRF